MSFSIVFSFSIDFSSILYSSVMSLAMGRGLGVAGSSLQWLLNLVDTLLLLFSSTGPALRRPSSLTCLVMIYSTTMFIFCFDSSDNIDWHVCLMPSVSEWTCLAIGSGLNCPASSRSFSLFSHSFSIFFASFCALLTFFYASSSCCSNWLIVFSLSSPFSCRCLLSCPF